MSHPPPDVTQSLSDQPDRLGLATGRQLMLAEWAPHRATWVAWPHERSDWPGKLETVHWCYVDIVRQLASVEPVEIIFESQAAQQRTWGRLEKTGVNLDHVGTHRFPTDRSWVRDSGGTFVVRRTAVGRTWRLAMVDWRFNAWAKYDNWTHDNRLPGRIAAVRGVERVPPMGPTSQEPLVLEGGSIDVNGAGVALTTEQCLLDEMVQARNPTLGREGVEGALATYLGVHTVLWLGQGIAGDDTHGHVDNLARFVDTSTVVVASESDPSDENYESLRDNLRRLRQTRVNGRQLTVVPVPMPRPLRYGSLRLPASYLNFYIANSLVLVPTFNDPSDRLALALLADLFSDRHVVGIHALDLVLGLGTLHCLTLQEPCV